jgi:signal transduction histidine kinase
MTRRAGRWLVLTASVVVVGWLVADIVRQVQLGIDDAGLFFMVGASTVGSIAALAVGWRSQHLRLALLMLWWLGTSAATDVGGDWPASRLAFTLVFAMTAVSAPAYAHMALAYPTGRIEDRVERALVATTYLVALCWQAVPALFFDPKSCAGCGIEAPSLIYTGTTFDYSFLGTVFAWVFIVLGIGFCALIFRRLHAAPRGALLTMAPLAAAGLFASVEFVVRWITVLANWYASRGTLDWFDRANTLVLPVAIVLGLAAVRRRRGPLGDLVVELGTATPGEVRAALARSVGDPSLELALWLPEQQRFVNEAGVTVAVHEMEGSGRSVTLVGTPYHPLAAIIHDDRLTGQRPLLEAAGSAARLALVNAQLQAELRAQLLELRESRSRIVAAADSERRRLERDLHDGAQQRLLALGLALQLMKKESPDPELLTEAEDELQNALHELRELARGIHPAILTEKGLASAVGSLIDRAPLPITADVCCERYPAPFESAAYFVVSEALANIAKHAHAVSAAVSIRRRGDQLVIEVSDNGCGGAASTAGGGLQGLADRVGALNGKLTITSPRGMGTTLHAEIPCASL